MGEAELDSLLERMPKIAAAVNEFKSEAIQQAVFNALLGAYGFKVAQATLANSAQAPDASHGQEDEAAATTTDEDAKSKTQASPKQPRQKKSSSGGNGQNYKFLRELDLRPEGKKSFFDFVSEKAPQTNEDKFAVAVYYLEQTLELPAVTADHVGTAFRMVPEWREPSDVKASLRVASSRKGTIVTTDMDNIRITPHGRNFVDHDLPQPAKAAKS
ncbi:MULTISPECIES: hypothetical protein [unclassified Mesorhizobium]|uniref:hypothetical protein n=1 Tax=unclassified Mesorhizobium TaxID=325217 RepID=UPI00112D3626|nr:MULTISPECIES: hypothetical protein [unclassified Mesorhizobium]TPI44959.1 hypothetical protein FJW11_30005 [Mesorhizobium sp. B3-1-1]TPJ57113.1 hypothetical protein FJ462_32275 [Mesorhizobium sp. B2-6-7]TPJ75529.1 hypothetical protein FJ422_31030 [Mesorhizobium sp. B2-6-3]TPJ90210.1 hypothetical protein FJ491_31945 [Mesorhizobium sp. B2-5-10]TPK03011.1 hypothetical protein FJ490_32065 [Mesorhizobium sp. B2-5-11]